MILIHYYSVFNCYGCTCRTIPIQERSRAVAVVFGGLSFGSVLGYVFSDIFVGNTYITVQLSHGFCWGCDDYAALNARNWIPIYRNLHLSGNPDSYRTLISWLIFFMFLKQHWVTFFLYDIITTQLNYLSADNITVICSPLPLFRTLAGSLYSTYLVFLELFGKQTFLRSS
jgi:hypothetical protein